MQPTQNVFTAEFKDAPAGWFTLLRERIVNFRPNDRALRRMELYMPSTDMFSDDRFSSETDDWAFRAVNAIVTEQMEHTMSRVTGLPAPKPGGWFAKVE
ncbi:hypothetical protein [Actinokineospora sp.]|uniref:hypothetical protein n=1 Tax=Actinokineospora sp. TaxID=1872133 RepID=UPI00403799C8